MLTAVGTVLAVAVALCVAVAAFFLSRRKTPPPTVVDDGRAKRDVAAVRAAAEAEAQATKRQAEIDARTAAHEAATAFDAQARAVEDELAARSLEAERRTLELERRATELTTRAEALTGREQALGERDAAAKVVKADADKTIAAERTELERIVGETGAELASRLTAEWLEEARAGAAERLRRVDAGVNDPEHTRTAKRIMGISVQRYQGHYLTERMLTNVPILPGALARIAGEGEENLRLLEGCRTSSCCRRRPATRSASTGRTPSAARSPAARSRAGARTA
jgi:hypothetical protein